MYGRDALRRVREQQTEEPATGLHSIDVPADAPMDDATLTVWNGARFVAYKRWQASVRVEADEAALDPVAALEGATVVEAICAGTRIWLVRNGERWFMFAGSRKPAARRKDFASPFLAHAMRTAEAWYGAAKGDWRPETTRDESNVREAASVPAQNRDLAEEACA